MTRTNESSRRIVRAAWIVLTGLVVLACYSVVRVVTRPSLTRAEVDALVSATNQPGTYNVRQFALPSDDPGTVRLELVGQPDPAKVATWLCITVEHADRAALFGPGIADLATTKQAPLQTFRCDSLRDAGKPPHSGIGAVIDSNRSNDAAHRQSA